MARQTKPKHVVPRSGRVNRIAVIGAGATLLTAVVVGIVLSAGRSDDAPSEQMLTPRPVPDGSGPVVDVYKSATCGCCSKWVEHLRGHGFTVRTTDTTELAAVKARHRVPPQVESCHTAVVDGYVLEGHVPAATVQRLLTERPAIAGVAVAGMPIGSPGMEVAGTPQQSYDVMAFDTEGATRVFATYR